MSNNQNDAAFLPPYHQQVFAHLNRLFYEEIDFRLTHKYSNLRRGWFLQQFDPHQPINSRVAWDFANVLLEQLDADMGKILSNRSAAYWLHIYRRIGAFLSPNHENKTDPQTVALVRGIVELMIQKHGKLESDGEFGFSDRLSPNLILGGWLKKALKAVGKKEGYGDKFFQKYSEILKSDPVLIIRSFGKNDYLGMYEVEGAAYQYWQLTALLRSLGKGASIRINRDGDWDYDPNAELARLIVSFDRRTETKQDFASLLGVWVDQEAITNTSEITDVYSRMLLQQVENDQKPGVLIPISAVHRQAPNDSNFSPAYFNIDELFESHSFMQATFRKHKGYDFRIFIDVLVALSSFALFPDKAIYADVDDLQAIIMASINQTLSRGYNVFIGSAGDLCELLAARIKRLLNTEYERLELKKVLDSLSLTTSRQSQISGWSGGPRSIVIPGEDIQIVDLASIPSVLNTLFVHMRDRDGDRGNVFEKLFQDALSRRGYSVKTGDLITDQGKQREIDAGVQIKDVLYIFECVSVERPLDYEIGRFKTIEGRKKRLQEKLDQAKTLKDFVEKRPVGTNYDYAKVSKFHHFVVSPFVEWVWSSDDDFWTKSKYPRIISPKEAFSILEEASC